MFVVLSHVCDRVYSIQYMFVVLSHLCVLYKINYDYSLCMDEEDNRISDEYPRNDSEEENRGSVSWKY